MMKMVRKTSKNYQKFHKNDIKIEKKETAKKDLEQNEEKHKEREE